MTNLLKSLPGLSSSQAEPWTATSRSYSGSAWNILPHVVFQGNYLSSQIQRGVISCRKPSLSPAAPSPDLQVGPHLPHSPLYYYYLIIGMFFPSRPSVPEGHSMQHQSLMSLPRMLSVIWKGPYKCSQNNKIGINGSKNTNNPFGS